MLCQSHGRGLEGTAEDGNGEVRIAGAAHEDVDSGEAAFRPCVNADVRLRKNNDARDAATLTELMQMRVQDGCPGRPRRVTQRSLNPFGISEVAGTPKIQQQVATGVPKAVLVDEIIWPDRDITANDITSSDAGSNLVFTVLRHFVFFPQPDLSKGRVDI